MKIQTQTPVLLLGLLFLLLANGHQIDSDHFCNLISERRHDHLRLESFTVHLDGGGGGDDFDSGDSCSIHFVEGGRRYGGTVDLTRDALNQTAVPLTLSKAPLSDRSKVDQISWRYTIDLTEGSWLKVAQADNGSHLLVGVQTRKGAPKEEERLTFTGDQRLQVAHSVVLGPKSWTGYLFFEVGSKEEDNKDNKDEDSIVGVVSICEFLLCQHNGEPPERSSARTYVGALRSASLLAPFQGGTQPYYVFVRDGEEQLVLQKSGGQPEVSTVAQQQLFRGRRRRRLPWPPLPLGFLCMTAHDGLRVYLFDVQRAVVRAFPYQGLGGRLADAIPLKTVEFWRFFNCHEPQQKINPDSTEKTASTSSEAEGLSFVAILSLMGLIGATFLLTSFLLYCCCCYRRAMAATASRFTHLEHSTTFRHLRSRRYQNQGLGQRERRGRSRMGGGGGGRYGGGGGRRRMMDTGTYGGGEPHRMNNNKGRRQSNRTIEESTNRSGRTISEKQKSDGSNSSSKSSTKNGSDPVAARTSLEITLPPKRKQQQQKGKQKPSPNRKQSPAPGKKTGNMVSKQQKILFSGDKSSQQPQQQGSCESEGLSKCLPKKTK